MKTSAAAATLLAAAPAALGQFVGLSARSGSEIQYGSINANSLSFWIGKDTSSYCPLSDASECPAGNATVFDGGEGGLALDTEVPGGQQVYIAPTGELMFTQAHSAFMPTGAITTGFTKSEGESFGYLSWTNGFVACPTNNTFPYKIYAQVDGFNLTQCLGFDFLTSNYTGTGAWQYV